MKHGKVLISEFPPNEVSQLAAYAECMQEEAGDRLPPPVRLHIGEPSFSTPAHIRAAAVEAFSREQLTYGPACGWHWLRNLLAHKIADVNGYVVDPSEIAIAVGGTGAILAALLATVGAGDEVLIPDPCWPHYGMQLAVCGATAVPYPLDPARAWLPDVARLETLVTARTKLLLINTPHNPTGTVVPPALIGALVDFAQRHDLYVLSDESYDEIIFEGRHVSPATLLSRREFEAGRIMCVYSFSKTYSMTGWRLGYITAGSRLIQTITTVLDACSSSVSTVVQRAGAAALTGPQECVAQVREAYRGRRDVAVGLLKEAGRFAYTPQGAFYVLVDVGDKLAPDYSVYQFAFDLIEARNVAVAPGSAFGAVARNHVRISLAASELEIAQGVRELCAFSRSRTPLLEGHR